MAPALVAALARDLVLTMRERPREHAIAGTDRVEYVPASPLLAHIVQTDILMPGITPL